MAGYELPPTENEREYYAQVGRIQEQERVIKVISEWTGHNGKTHYAGINCDTCKLFGKIRGDND